VPDRNSSGTVPPLQSSQWNLTKDSQKSPDHDNPNKLVTPRSLPPRRPSVPTFHSHPSASTPRSLREHSRVPPRRHLPLVQFEYTVYPYRTSSKETSTSEPCPWCNRARRFKPLMAPPFSRLRKGERALLLPRGIGDVDFDRAGILPRGFIYSR
jgi:hypothetical protein